MSIDKTKEGKTLPVFEQDTLFYRYRWPRRAIVYGSIIGAGVLGWNYYQAGLALNSFEDPAFSFSDPSGMSFSVKDFERESGVFKSTGKFSWMMQNDCSEESISLAEVSYVVSHLPWENNKISLTVRPNEKLIELADGSVREVKVDGRISNQGALIEYRLPKTEFLNFSSEPLFTVNNGAEGFIRTSWKQSRIEIEARGDLLTLNNYQNAEFRGFGSYFDLNPTSNSTVVLGAEKYKSNDLFVDKPSMQARTSAYGFSGKRLDYTVKTGDFSAMGVYTRSLESSGSLQVEDWPNLKEVLRQVYKTCAGVRADEESRLRTRLALNEVVKKGVSFEVSDLYLDGESGPLRGKLAVDIQFDEIGRAADLHQALNVKGKVLLTPGLFDLKLLEDTRSAGALFVNNQGEYLGAFSYSGKQLRLNDNLNAGTIDSGLFNFLRTANLDASFAQVYENLTMGISPFEPLNAIYKEPPAPIGEVQEVSVTENLLKKSSDKGIIRRSSDLVNKDGISFSVRIPR